MRPQMTRVETFSLGTRDDCVGMAEVKQNNPPAIEKCPLCAMCHFLMAWWGRATTWHEHLQIRDVFLLRVCLSALSLRPLCQWLRKETLSWWYTATCFFCQIHHEQSGWLNFQGCWFIVLSVEMLLSDVFSEVDKLWVHFYHWLLKLCAVFLCVCYSNGTPALWTL